MSASRPPDDTPPRLEAKQECIRVEVSDGYEDNAFDNRIAALLIDPAVSKIVGPRIQSGGFNPAGSDGTRFFTIWYVRTVHD